MFKRNTAVVGFPLGLVNATTGAAVTTGTVTGYVTKDGGTQATIAGTVVHEGNGQWSVNLTAGEMDGDLVGLLFTHASAIPVHFTIRTTTELVSDLTDATPAAITTAVWAGAPAGTPLADFADAVLDLMESRTYAELSGPPAATGSIVDAIRWLKMLARNKVTTTASTIALRNDADGANVATATHAESGGTYTRNEWS